MLLSIPLVLEAGRELTRRYFAGETEAIWARLTPQMQAALGSLANLDATRALVEAQAGTEQAVFGEWTEAADGVRVYRRIARFSKARVEIELRWAFDGADRVAGFFIRPSALREAVAKHETAKTRLLLPVHGAWTVVWGGRTLAQNYHAFSRNQRFAFDLLVVRDGLTHRGNNLEDCFAFGQPICAPADGTVATAVDGVPDQPAGSGPSVDPLGNHLVIDHGNGEYSFLCHLQSGSVKPKAGDTLHAGDLLGLCGNSGNTTSEPHLHYHLQDSPLPFDGDGLPAEFSDYLADGVRVDRGMPLRGQVISR